MADPTHNPFASPAVAATQTTPDRDSQTTFPDFNAGKSFGKWTLVCTLSAAPSFFWAGALGADVLVRSAAMLTGIATFIAFFVYLESLEWTQRKLLDRKLRSAVKAGFITRVIISIVFPVAMLLDLWCGMISISIIAGLSGFEPAAPNGTNHLNSLLTFGWFYATTIVQGIILNLVLGTFTMLIYGGITIYRGMKKG